MSLQGGGRGWVHGGVRMQGGPVVGSTCVGGRWAGSDDGGGVHAHTGMPAHPPPASPTHSLHRAARPPTHPTPPVKVPLLVHEGQPLQHLVRPVAHARLSKVLPAGKGGGKRGGGGKPGWLAPSAGASGAAPRPPRSAAPDNERPAAAACGSARHRYPSAASLAGRNAAASFRAGTPLRTMLLPGDARCGLLPAAAATPCLVSVLHHLIQVAVLRAGDATHVVGARDPVQGCLPLADAPSAASPSSTRPGLAERCVVALHVSSRCVRPTRHHCRPPTMYSNTKNSSSFSRITSLSCTMQGWCSLRRLRTCRRGGPQHHTRSGDGGWARCGDSCSEPWLRLQRSPCNSASLCCQLPQAQINIKLRSAPLGAPRAAPGTHPSCKTCASSS